MFLFRGGWFLLGILGCLVCQQKDDCGLTVPLFVDEIHVPGQTGIDARLFVSQCARNISLCAHCVAIVGMKAQVAVL